MSGEFQEGAEAERLGSNPLNPDELALIADVLRPAFTYSEASFSPDYDERRELGWDTLDAVFAMQDSLTNRRGEKLAIKDPVGWRPDVVQREQLREQLGSVQRRFRMLRGVERCLKDETFVETLPGTPLRWNQEEMMDAWADFLMHASRSVDEDGKSQKGKSGALISATGTGKTGVIAKAIAMMKTGELEHDPFTTVVLEPTQDLVAQTVGASGDRGLGRFAPHLDVGEYFQHNKQLKKPVVVMCIPSFLKLVAEGKMPFFDAVIVDEAHLALGQKVGDAIKEYASDKILVGVTATDEYSPDRTVFEVFDHEIYRMGLVEAVKRGVLAPVRAFLLKAEPVIDPSTLPLDPVEQRRAIRAARLRARLEVAIPIIRKEVERGVGTFVKVPPGDKTAHAFDYAKTLRDHIVHGEAGIGRARWINAQPVSGVRSKQTRKQRVEIIDNYDDGDGDVLVSVRLLREGVDLPHTKGFIDAHPGTSKVDKEQWSGRALRLTVDPFTSKPIEAHLYDFEDKELGNAQATAIKLLNLKHGEAIGPDRPYHEEAEASKKRRQAKRRPEAVRLEAIDVGVLGEVAVGHGKGVDKLIEAGSIAVATATFRDEKLDLAGAARELGVSPRLLGELLEQVGSDPDDIKLEELALIRELFPEKLKFQELPEEGWIDIRDVAANIAENLEASPRLLTFVGTARVNGIHSRTFRAPYGNARFYNYRQVNAIRRLYGLGPLSADEIVGLSAHRLQD